MEFRLDHFIDEIFDIEARGMLSDLSVNLMSNFIGFEESDNKRALTYIKSVLSECYSAGHLRVAASYYNSDLHGYALMFIPPDSNSPLYLHKIFIKEQFRGNGLGTKILTSIINASDVCLLCSSELVVFYERHGFNFAQQFEAPKSESFKLSQGLYADLYVMKNYKEDISAPIFMLNDEDLRSIFGA